jgi:hypothetical protein
MPAIRRLAPYTIAVALGILLPLGYTMYVEWQHYALMERQTQEQQRVARERAERIARDRPAREALLAELRIVTLKNCTLKRYGGPNDGGYLMCGNLLRGARAAYSYGIGDEDEWGCQVSRQFGLKIHQYDCFTATRPACEGGRFVFHNECVGARREIVESRRFDSIAAQIAANGDAGKRILLKIDVEGAEWETLLAAPDSLLDRIDQMAMELHLGDSPVAKSLELIRRLKTRFHLVNLHFNNHSCEDVFHPLPAPVFQVLWVSKRLGRVDPNGPSAAPPSHLNAPDVPRRPDCQLSGSAARDGTAAQHDWRAAAGAGTPPA